MEDFQKPLTYSNWSSFGLHRPITETKLVKLDQASYGVFIACVRSVCWMYLWIRHETQDKIELIFCLIKTLLGPLAEEKLDLKTSQASYGMFSSCI